MLTYDEAVAQAASGKGLLVSNAGGRKRYAMFTLRADGVVEARLFRTVIAEFDRVLVTVRTGGYNTATTVEALNALTRGSFGTVKRVLYAHSWRPEAVPFTEGMRLDYDGRVIAEGAEAPPERKGRRRRYVDGVLR